MCGVCSTSPNRSLHLYCVPALGFQHALIDPNAKLKKPSSRTFSFRSYDFLLVTSKMTRRESKTHTDGLVCVSVVRRRLHESCRLYVRWMGLSNRSICVAKGEIQVEFIGTRGFVHCPAVRAVLHQAEGSAGPSHRRRFHMAVHSTKEYIQSLNPGTKHISGDNRPLPANGARQRPGQRCKERKERHDARERSGFGEGES